jgi:hypothetical protein
VTGAHPPEIAGPPDAHLNAAIFEQKHYGAGDVALVRAGQPSQDPGRVHDELVGDRPPDRRMDERWHP